MRGSWIRFAPQNSQNVEGVRSSPVWGTRTKFTFIQYFRVGIDIPVYAIPVPVCTIQYLYSCGAHRNIKSDSRVWNLFSRACHIPVCNTGINWIPVEGIKSFS